MRRMTIRKMNRTTLALTLFMVLALFGAMALRFDPPAAGAQGAGTTILVNSTVQEATAANFNGLTNGNCTLGEAILSANADSDIGGCVRTGSGNPFTLALSQATYTLTAIHHYEYGPAGLPPIASRIVIEGNGAIIECNANAPRFRLLYVSGGLSYDAGTQQGLPEGNLTLRDVTLRGGLAKGGDSGDGGGAGMGAGGAIFNQGSLQLERVTLTENQALGGSAGVLGNFVYGGGGIGQDAQGFLGAGGFGGPPLGLGGAGGLGNLLPGYGGGGGGFLPGAGGGNADISVGNGGGQGGLGGHGYGSNRGDGGGGSDLEGLGQGAAGGGFGFGGGSNSALGGGGGGGVGGGGGGIGGGGGFGGGGSVLADGGFGAGGGSGGFGGFGGGSGRDDIGGGGGLGGAIFNHRGNLTLTNCTLTANTAQGGTGTNSSASGDDGSGLGGAIFNLNGEIRLSFSTLAANTVINGTGGAVYNLAFGNRIEDGSASEAAVELHNTLLATSVDGGGNPVSDLVNDKRDGNQTNLATVTYDGPNLVMSRTEQNGATSSGSPAQTANPNLQPLALNTQGLTPTMALTLASTPALNQGACTIQVATDQRGVTRPQGAACDIGAVEVIQNNSTTAITLQIDPATDPAGAANELIGAINLANLEASATTITLMCGTYTLTERNNTFYGFTGLPVITTPITIEGNGAVIERAAPAPGFRLFAIARQDPATGGALAVPGSLTLSQVTLRGGLAQGGAGGDSSEGGGGGGAGLGGAVYNQGTLNIQRSAFIANTAQGGQGGSRVGSSGEGAGGGGLGGNGGANTFSTNGGSGGGGFGGNGGLGASTGGGGGEGGGQIANGNNGQGDIGGSGGSAEGGDGGSETPAPNDDIGSPGGFGGGGGGGNLANGGAGGIGGGGGGGSGNGPGGSGGFGGGGGGGFGGGGGGSEFGSGFGGFGAGGGGGERGGGGAGLGGAIFNDGGALTILNSTISSNTAIGGAAGDAAAMSAQSGQGMGGGIFARNGTVTINNVTLNNNTVMQGPGQAPASAPEPEGGSLYLLGDGQPVRPGDSINIFYKVTNSILANTPGGASDGFILTINGGELRPITNNNNLVETNGSEPNADSFDLSGVTRTEDPQLGALTAANCGSGGCHAPVHPIAATSPAFNAAGGNAETADQCGTARLSGTADIGAYEFPCMLALSPASGEFPAADAGTAFSQTFTAMNPSGAVTFLFAGGLPPGLNFTPSGPGTAQLAGIPTLPGSYNFSVTANEANGCLATQTYSLTVNCPAITIAPASLPSAQVNVAYAQVITNVPAAGFYGFAVTSGLLPAGLTLNADGSFSGAPTQSGVFNFRVTASGFSGGSGVCASFRDYALLVKCTAITVNPANLPGGNIGASYNQTVSAAPAGTYSFSVSSGALPPGLMLNAATGTITGLPAQSGTYNFRITASAGGCTGARDYTVSISCPAISLASLTNATAGANYSGSVAASPAGSYNYSLTSGSLPAGLTLHPTTGAIYGLPAVTGTFNFTVKAQTPNGCSATQSYTLTVACPAITLSSLAAPTVNSPYNQTVTASPSGGSYSFAVTAGGLPTGLSLNPATGVLSGTPTLGGTFNFTITATGFGGCAGARAYSLTLGDGGCPTITLADLPGGQPGQLYNASATASPSGSYSYAVTAGSLPPGVTLYGSLGMLFGYPTTAGTFNFTITATGSNNCKGSKAFSVQIGGAALRSLVFGDFDGDGKADLSVWRGASGEWLTINSSDGQSRTEVWGTSAAPYFDVMTPGDFDGDGRMDPAVFRRGIQTGQDGEWLIKRSSDGAVTAKAWGLATDIPVPGDYDGDGKTDLAVWRGEQGNWYIQRSSDNQTETVFWGTSNAPYRDLPVAADYDGDGKMDIAVFRQQNGHWYIRQSSDGSTIAKHWGLGTDVPVAADYDGDGKADIAVWRGSDTNWHILRSSDGMTQSISWGASTLGDWAVPGDFDGDGKADVAVWRAWEGVWYVQFSGEPGGISKALGRSGDIPVNRR